MCESVGKVYLLPDNFYSNQTREAVVLPLTCHPSPYFTTFAFRSSEVRRLLLDFDPYFMALCLSVVFRRYVRFGSFPDCWRQTNVTPIPKGPPSSSVCQLPTVFHNISIV